MGLGKVGVAVMDHWKEPQGDVVVEYLDCGGA